MGIAQIFSACFSDKRQQPSSRQRSRRDTLVEESYKKQSNEEEKKTTSSVEEDTIKFELGEDVCKATTGPIKQEQQDEDKQILEGLDTLAESTEQLESMSTTSSVSLESIHHSQSLDSISTKTQKSEKVASMKKSESLDHLSLKKNNERGKSSAKVPPTRPPSTLSNLVGILGSTKTKPSSSKMPRSSSAEPISGYQKTTTRRRSSSGSRGSFLESLKSRTSSSSSGDLHSAALVSVLEEAKYGQRSLEEVMDAMHDLIEEPPEHAVRMLYDYLARKEVVRRLVEFVIMDDETPSGRSLSNSSLIDETEQDTRRKARYPYIASEVLAYGPRKPRRVLIDDHEALDKLFAYLERDPPLNLITAGRFAKVIASMIQEKPVRICLQLLKRFDSSIFRKETKNISLIVKHIGTDSIAELLVRLVAEVNDGDSKQLYFENINHEAGRLLAKVDLFKLFNDRFHEACKNGKMSSYEEEVVANISVTILGITIRVMMTTTPSVFSADPSLNHSIKYANAINIFNEPDNIGAILDDSINAVYNGDNLGIALCSTLRMIRDLYRALMRGRESPIEDVRLPVQSLNTSRFENMLRKRFPSLRSILLRSPNGSETTFATENSSPRLGRLRLRIAEFFIDILCGARFETVRAIIVNNIHRTIGEMFVYYEHNSLLHSLLADGAEFFLLHRKDAESERVLFAEFLMELVLDQWKKFEVDPLLSPQTLHPGSLGAVLKIAQVLERFCKKVPVETENSVVFKQLYDSSISELIKEQKGVLGGVEPPRNSQNWVSTERLSTRVLEAAPHESIGEALRVRLGLERRKKSGGQAEQGFFNVIHPPF
eukprot:jgi/Galph1/4196/GphlegSOOS_G2798.1